MAFVIESDPFEDENEVKNKQYVLLLQAQHILHEQRMNELLEIKKWHNQRLLLLKEYNEICEKILRVDSIITREVDVKKETLEILRLLKKEKQLEIEDHLNSKPEIHV